MEEERAPPNNYRLRSQRGGQFELILSALLYPLNLIDTYECRVLIRLQHDMQHFPSIFTHLIDKTLTYSQESWESSLHYLIEVGSVFSRFKAEDATYGEKALEACENRGGIVGIQQLNRDIDESRPFFWKIEVKNLL